MSFPLLNTKFFIPAPSRQLVDRPHIDARLNEGIQHTLTLVCAPAGYGKTTLLANWISKSINDGLVSTASHLVIRRPSVCWLALDPADNDLARWLRYLTEVFERVEPGSVIEARAMLESFPFPPPQSIMTALINNINQIASPIILMLDDYQFISNPDVHECIRFFLEHIPPNIHLVIATRSDPPIPFARLRARGQLTEIRADDLRFSDQEAAEFLTRVMDLCLTSQDITRLAERTEGWIAGLQMAAVALQSVSQDKHTDIAPFVENFSGSNRYILDYLVEEVLSHQPEPVQNFLLNTSILEMLCGSLCDQVNGTSFREADNDAASGQQILEYLDRSNLFLVSLDPDRRWYRYHHLFTDLLRARLEQHAPNQVAGLHRRASEWYEQNQRLPEAVNHALDAGDTQRACQLIEPQVERMLGQNGIGVLLNWIRRLPNEITLSSPWLCLTQAWSAMFVNSVEKIEPFLAAAEQSILPEDSPEYQQSWRGQIACLRAFVADVHKNQSETIQMAHQALEYLRPDDVVNRTFAKHMLGRAYFISGDFPQAVITLTENMRECIAAKTTNIIAPTIAALSKVYRIEGRLRDSIALVQEGQDYIEKCDPRRVTVAGVALTGQARCLHEWNNLQSAENLAQHWLELCEPWVNPSSTCSGYTLLARIFQDQGNLGRAAEALQSAQETIRGRSPLVEVVSELNTVQVGFWLLTGQKSMAVQWAQESMKAAHPADPFSIAREQNEITIARVMLAVEPPEIALKLLAPLAFSAEAGERFGHLIEIRNLQVLALQAKGDQEAALEILEKNLALAEPESYLRSFINEGEPMRTLLAAYLRTVSPIYKTYARQLLAAFNRPDQPAPPFAQFSNLIEPLTPREIEVLQWIAEGFSNRQIAERLFLAEGTVKFYVHTVLEKLGVHNRTQAIIEAKKQKII